MRDATKRTVVAVLLCVIATACASPQEAAGPTTRPSPESGTYPSGEPTGGPTGGPPGGPTGEPTGRPCVEEGSQGSQTCPATGRGSRPPDWWGTRPLPVDPATGYGEVRPTPPALRHRRWTLPDTVAPLPGRGYRAKVRAPAPRAVLRRSTWHPGCPVRARDLAWVRLAFWGFDGRRHTGELLVHREVAHDIVEVFGVLYRTRFPQESVGIVRTWDPDAPPTGDGGGTGALVCRPSTGASYFSQHAYGLAIDVNAFHNPYVKGDVLLPELASGYLRRGDVRPGVVSSTGPVVEAFAAIGWEWGGSWRYSKDYMHFSRNGL